MQKDPPAQSQLISRKDLKMKIKTTIILTASIIFNILLVNGQSPIGENMIVRNIEKQKIQDWQKAIAKTENKTILDYYLLLPKSLLEAESEIINDSKEFRLEKANSDNPNHGRVNIKSGYLIASPDIWLKMAVFKDRINRKDIIAIEFGCGPPPNMYCDYGFIEFDSEKLIWSINKNVFPWDKFEKIYLEQSKDDNIEPFIPNLIIPEFGTDIKMVDAWNTEKTVYTFKWNGQKFE